MSCDTPEKGWASSVLTPYGEHLAGCSPELPGTFSPFCGIFQTMWAAPPEEGQREMRAVLLPWDPTHGPHGPPLSWGMESGRVFCANLRAGPNPSTWVTCTQGSHCEPGGNGSLAVGLWNYAFFKTCVCISLLFNEWLPLYLHVPPSTGQIGFSGLRMKTSRPQGRGGKK